MQAQWRIQWCWICRYIWHVCDTWRIFHWNQTSWQSLENYVCIFEFINRHNISQCSSSQLHGMYIVTWWMLFYEYEWKIKFEYFEVHLGYCIYHQDIVSNVISPLNFIIALTTEMCTSALFRLLLGIIAEYWKCFMLLTWVAVLVVRLNSRWCSNKGSWCTRRISVW